MIHEIKGETINEVVFNAIDNLINKGARTPSRNGNINVIYNAVLSQKNPRARHLALEGRKNNIFAMIAETFWVMSGSILIDPYLIHFLPRARDFSDDGETWRGGYGERFYRFGQMESMLNKFKKDSLFTRRANLYIGNPDLDTDMSLEYVYHLESTKDQPCNQLINIFVDNEKRLNLNMFSRSGDIIWGLGSINIFEFTYLQEFVTHWLRENIDSEVKLGEYTHFCTNMHLYDFTGQQGYDVLKNRDKQKLNLENRHSIIFPVKSSQEFRDFHDNIVRMQSKLIVNKETDYKAGQEINDFLIENWDVKDILLQKYIELVTAFIITKNRGLKKGEIAEDIMIDISMLPEEVKWSIEYSPFRKFQIKV